MGGMGELFKSFFKKKFWRLGCIQLVLGSLGGSCRVMFET